MLAFDPSRKNQQIQLRDGGRTASTVGKWGTVFLAHAGVTDGIIVFSVRVDSHTSPSGCAIGIADADAFDPTRNVIGAAAHSWAYTMTGDKGNGSGFMHYGDSFSDGTLRL